MPLYDYECDGCGHVFELRQSFSAEPVGDCPKCSGVSRRKFHAVPIIYKGSGFYTTDYKKSGYSPPSDDTDKSEEKAADKKTKDEPVKASSNDTKPAAKATAASSSDQN